jgi:hypothetical protein
VYYRKIRELAANLAEDFVVVVSRATPDGGKEGHVSEVLRDVACKLVVEEKARLASAEEAQAFRKQTQEAAQKADKADAFRKLQMLALTELETKLAKGGARTAK